MESRPFSRGALLLFLARRVARDHQGVIVSYRAREGGTPTRAQATPRFLSKSVVDNSRHSHRDASNLDFLLCLPGGAVVDVLPRPCRCRNCCDAQGGGPRVPDPALLRNELEQNRSWPVRVRRVVFIQMRRLCALKGRRSLSTRRDFR